MKATNGFPHRRLWRTEAAQRSRILAAFDRSGLSAAAFARRVDTKTGTKRAEKGSGE